ncbi:MAG: efflux transporter periplasmic adaptor subunit [Panacagrimonas sp.]|jgi:RND family efflux transporter MFP subunit|nr:efflux RND transporter periplasmic adaptor subunit [Panacagrimonas sp.]MCC2656610.1 efflux transporter periplasmic adaptor subunit [Panacagrimonas sp.]
MRNQLDSMRIVPVIGLAIGVLAGCAAKDPPVHAPRPVVVETPQALGASGAVEAYPGSVHARIEADLSFRVPGKISQRKVDMGQKVTPGMVLAVLDPQDANLNLDAASAALKAAEADAWLAAEEERRYRDLKERGHVGQSAVDQRINTSKLAQARLDQARSQLNLAQNQSRYTRLTADRAGVVTQVMAEPGNVVSAGQPVVRVAEDGEREVWIDVPEGRLDGIAQAQKIAIEIYSRPGKRYGARVREINPQADTATRTHQARVTILDPDSAVQLGVTATVVTVDAGDGKTFRLPATALGALPGGKPVVWTVTSAPAAEDGAPLETVKPVPVQVVQYLDGAVVVAGALTTQDRLVTAGVHRLVDGMRVRPIERAAKAAL